ncbi:MAG: SRPBCC family protein [Spirochaetales bacterium]|nr:SRPBCC family protein [Spirochaetales bacterium]
MDTNQNRNPQSGPRWRNASRIERVDTFELNGPPEKVFPLLCPVLEYDWIPDWRCTMFWAKSGVAEKDAVFHTKEALGRTAVWTCITYEPDALIEYLIVSGKDVVMRLTLSLECKGPEKTRMTWRMLFTMSSVLGQAVVTKTFSEAKFKAFTRLREKQINDYLEYGAKFWKTKV